jgi:hypothetical protein
MKPIQDASQIVGDDNCIQTTNPSNSKALDESDLAEIEQIVKEKMVSAEVVEVTKPKLIFNFYFHRKNTKLV